MATKKSITPQTITSQPDTPEEKLRKKVWHLLVDLNLTATGTSVKLAAVLSQRIGKYVSRNTLAMALSGYRSTAPYIRYLSELKKHLQYCKAHKLDPVIVYTQPNPINKHKKEGRHYE